MNIIELVRQADPGFEFRSSGALADCLVGFDAIERFAALVRAAALEEQPTKQPLTTQEIDAVMRKALGYGLSPSRDDLDFARAIERAHGIGETK